MVLLNKTVFFGCTALALATEPVAPEVRWKCPSDGSSTESVSSFQDVTEADVEKLILLPDETDPGTKPEPFPFSHNKSIATSLTATWAYGTPLKFEFSFSTGVMVSEIKFWVYFHSYQHTEMRHSFEVNNHPSVRFDDLNFTKWTGHGWYHEAYYGIGTIKINSPREVNKFTVTIKRAGSEAGAQYYQVYGFAIKLAKPTKATKQPTKPKQPKQQPTKPTKEPTKPTKQATTKQEPKQEATKQKTRSLDGWVIGLIIAGVVLVGLIVGLCVWHKKFRKGDDNPNAVKKDRSDAANPDD